MGRNLIKSDIVSGVQGASTPWPPTTQTTKEIAMHITDDIKARFWAKVDKQGNDDCWNWTGSLRGRRYGDLRVNGPKEKAHRVSWVIHNSQIPDGICVCHRCDNPACVNPSHLFTGTHADNMADRDMKGRLGPRHGEYGSNTKLTEKQVIEIIRLRGGVTQVTLAERFGVSPSTIGMIHINKTWRHIR